MAIALEADVATAAAILVSLAFALVEVRRDRTRRREAAAVEIVHSFQSSEFARALRTFTATPGGLSAEDVRADPAREHDAYVLANTFEAIGVLVHRRVAPLDVVQDLMGGAVVPLWTKLRPWVEHLRTSHARPSWYEWFQWLADALERNPAAYKRVGAHVAFRDWKPQP